VEIDLSDISPQSRYFLMTQTVIPRPIAWVLTRNVSGSFNLAPFSYFNAVCSDPPLLMFSVGMGDGGGPKDTRANVEREGAFVVNIVDAPRIEQMNQSSASEEYGVSEVDKLGIDVCPLGDLGIPRLAASPVSFSCSLYQTLEIGKSRQLLVFGEIRRVHLSDDVASVGPDGRVRVDAARVNPVGRLGAGEYMLKGEILRLKRPA